MTTKKMTENLNEDFDWTDDDLDNYPTPGLDEEYEEFLEAIGEDPWGCKW